MLPGTRFQAGDDFYLDWFPRGGDNMIVRVQLLDYTDTPALTIKFYTKNHDDTGDGTVVKDASSSDYSLSLSYSQGIDTIAQVIVTSTGTSGQGLLELVRMRVTVTGSGSLLARMFSPIFFDSATPP